MNLGRWKEFVSLVSIDTDECVLWPHHLTHDGYGRVYHDGRHRYVNVLACERAHGPNPGGLDAAHSCGVRRCLNPRHLAWKDRKTNMHDQLAHGTRTTGESNSQAKMTWPIIEEARRMHRRGMPVSQIAAFAGVAVPTLEAALYGRTWR